MRHKNRAKRIKARKVRENSRRNKFALSSYDAMATIITPPELVPVETVPELAPVETTPELAETPVKVRRVNATKAKGKPRTIVSKKVTTLKVSGEETV